VINQIKVLAKRGKVQFRVFEDGRHECRFEAEQDGQRILFAEQTDSLERALDQVFIKAVNEGLVPVIEATPRVITRTMTDGIRTKDGAA
jgi:hypothetical protein